MCVFWVSILRQMLNMGHFSWLTIWSNNKIWDIPFSILFRSALWSKNKQRGLFGITSSPKSLRSSSLQNTVLRHRHRSSSVESHSSSDSRNGRKHRSRNSRHSDNESEISRGSGLSSRSPRKQRRHRSRSRESGFMCQIYSNVNHRQHIPLVDSKKQWLAVQRRQAALSNTEPLLQSNDQKIVDRNKNAKER